MLGGGVEWDIPNWRFGLRVVVRIGVGLGLGAAKGLGVRFGIWDPLSYVLAAKGMWVRP